MSLERTRALRPFINKMERTVLVSPVYSSNLVRVQKTTAGSLASVAIRDAREGRPSTRAEFLNAEANPSSRHECERQASVIKFFFDYDDGETYHQRPADEELDVLQHELSSEVECILKEGAGVNREETPYDIHVACRHGYITAKSTGETHYKLSLRFFVSGLRTDMYSIRSAVRLAALKKHGDPKRARFDLSVYSKNRRMCMILGIKDKTDLRMLTPIAAEGAPLDDPRFICNYVIQYVEETGWPFVKVDPNMEFTYNQSRLAGSASSATQRSGKKGSKRGGSARLSDLEDSSAEEDEAAGDQAEEDEEEDEEATRNVKRKKEENVFDIVKTALRVSGFTNAVQLGPDNHSSSGGSTSTFVPFTCDERACCPICKQPHDRNNWFVHISKEYGIQVANQSQRCDKVGLINPVFLHPFVRCLLNGENSHRIYGEAYLKSREGTVLFNEATSKFHEFKQQKWEELPDELVMDGVSTYMRSQILDPETDKIKEWKSALKRLKVGNEKIQERVNHYLNEVLKAKNNMGTYTFLSNTVKMSKGMVFAPSKTFNRKHNLLHFDNGALDLTTMELRDAVPEDYNTMTTGYEYHPEESNAEAVKLHQAFIQKVYPDPNLREVAQRVLGSTLSGYNHSKKLFMFTDNGGELGGNNGKTKIFGLHLLSMGDYAVMAKKDFLYDSAHSNPEAASPFMCKLEGKRAVMVEELEPNKKMAEGFIKEMTNGTNAMVPVRELYRGSRIMEVCCKIMVGFNHGKSPRFDPYDEALTKRFLPVPHISHFTSDRRLWDPMKHVYPMEADIGEKINAECRLAHMLWCLEGYKAFKEKGLELDSMPKSIADFKKVLVFKNTPVYAYLGEVLEETDNREKDVVEMTSVWELYKKDKRSIRWLTLDQFEASFKVFVNGRVNNAYQRVMTSSGGQSRTAVARGFKIKAPSLPFTLGGGSTWGASDAERFF